MRDYIGSGISFLLTNIIQTFMTIILVEHDQNHELFKLLADLVSWL